MNDIEEIIFAPISDEDYAKRMRKIREAIRFQQMKYGKVARKIATQNFKYMFVKESRANEMKYDEYFSEEIKGAVA